MTKVWVQRDDDSEIVAVYSWAAFGATEVESSEEIAAFLSGPALPARIAKNAIWERATEGEAEAMEAMLLQQHVRIRRIYEGATHVSTDHELFTMLSQGLTQAFGAARAAELLCATG